MVAAVASNRCPRCIDPLENTASGLLGIRDDLVPMDGTHGISRDAVVALRRTKPPDSRGFCSSEGDHCIPGNSVGTIHGYQIVTDPEEPARGVLQRIYATWAPIRGDGRNHRGGREMGSRRSRDRR